MMGLKQMKQLNESEVFLDISSTEMLKHACIQQP